MFRYGELRHDHENNRNYFTYCDTEGPQPTRHLTVVEKSYLYVLNDLGRQGWEVIGRYDDTFLLKQSTTIKSPYTPRKRKKTAAPPA